MLAVTTGAMVTDTARNDANNHSFTQQFRVEGPRMERRN